MSNGCIFNFLIVNQRALMDAMIEVRVALIVVTIVMISNCMVGMGRSRDSFKDLNIKCSIAGPSKWQFGSVFSFAWLVCQLLIYPTLFIYFNAFGNIFCKSIQSRLHSQSVHWCFWNMRTFSVSLIFTGSLQFLLCPSLLLEDLQFLLCCMWIIFII